MSLTLLKGLMPHVPQMLPFLITDPEMRSRAEETFMSPEFQENIEEYFVANIKVDITIGSFSSRSEHVFFVLWLSHERPCKCQMLIKNDQSWEGSNTRPCYQSDATRTVPRPELGGAMSVLIVGHWSHQGLKTAQFLRFKTKTCRITWI